MTSGAAVHTQASPNVRRPSAATATPRRLARTWSQARAALPAASWEPRRHAPRAPTARIGTATSHQRNAPTRPRKYTKNPIGMTPASQAAGASPASDGNPTARRSQLPTCQHAHSARRAVTKRQHLPAEGERPQEDDAGERPRGRDGDPEPARRGKNRPRADGPHREDVPQHQAAGEAGGQEGALVGAHQVAEVADLDHDHEGEERGAAQRQPGLQPRSRRSAHRPSLQRRTANLKAVEHPRHGSGGQLAWRSVATETNPLVQRFLGLPEVDVEQIDGAKRLEAHAAVLRRKPMLAEVFRECHQAFMDLDLRCFGDTPGTRIELGAGVAPVRSTYSEVLATDVVPGAGLDRVIDAMDIDVPEGSVRALYGQNCFHHLPEPERFLSSAERAVAPGGGVILIEPFYGPVASVLYKHLFASEDFEKDMAGWTTDASGPMTGANQALSYIVFVRDRAEFERRFPALELVGSRPLGNYVRYLASGGLNFRQLVPTASAGLLKRLEAAIARANRRLALHQIIVLRRR